MSNLNVDLLSCWRNPNHWQNYLGEEKKTKDTNRSTTTSLTNNWSPPSPAHYWERVRLYCDSLCVPVELKEGREREREREKTTNLLLYRCAAAACSCSWCSAVLPTQWARKAKKPCSYDRIIQVTHNRDPVPFSPSSSFLLLFLLLHFGMTK